LAASAEAVREHPLAQAVVAHARAQGVTLLLAGEFQAVPGRGVRAVVDGQRVLVGSPSFLAAEGVDMEPLRARIEVKERQGQTVMAVAAAGQLMGLIAVADTLKPDAVQAIAEMKAAGLEPVMITGDNERTARAVTRAVGIERVLGPGAARREGRPGAGEWPWSATVSTTPRP